MCDFHIFIDIFEDISPFHHFNHFFVKFFSCGVWGGCGGVAGLHRKVFINVWWWLWIFFYINIISNTHKPATIGKHRQNILLINLNHRNDIVKEYLNEEEDK